MAILKEERKIEHPFIGRSVYKEVEHSLKEEKTYKS